MQYLSCKLGLFLEITHINMERVNFNVIFILGQKLVVCDTEMVQ